jgi:hypothetical protein
MAVGAAVVLAVQILLGVYDIRQAPQACLGTESVALHHPIDFIRPRKAELPGWHVYRRADVDHLLRENRHTLVLCDGNGDWIGYRPKLMSSSAAYAEVSRRIGVPFVDEQRLANQLRSGFVHKLTFWISGGTGVARIAVRWFENGRLIQKGRLIENELFRSSVDSPDQPLRIELELAIPRGAKSVGFIVATEGFEASATYTRKPTRTRVAEHDSP